ncbi:glutathione S-transferase [Acetobacter cibinongensis]|uniref:Glutathione S-transferase n=1 Tax=Acetobacter cibinongensis TaxID=146475 RepID=A0A0D6N104_9PROT|nr:glutathione S-transferase C-terminal domain-containing protein [Acetobacter cibinongensis]GAN59400.1 glutathione S-transferase [Acetobacter cibinongensis]GBQ15570.1 glutathione S-transferase [Acetobacter cibinongensis NRIC 0482]GEL59744.1 glutathione S-transferase [Acetobacter cibinongensis]
MLHFYYGPGPNPIKIALFLAETGVPFEAIPVDTYRGAQHDTAFRSINPNGKVPALVDTDSPRGTPATLFDSTAILLYLSEKTGQFLGEAQDRPQLLSWLMFIATGLGPFSGQAVHFQHAAPEGLEYAVNRYRREAERHYQVLNDHLEGRSFIVGDHYTIADMSAWGWLDRAARVLKEEDKPLHCWPNLTRFMTMMNARPAVEQARAIMNRHSFKTVMDEDAREAMFPTSFTSASQGTMS